MLIVALVLVFVIAAMVIALGGTSRSDASLSANLMATRQARLVEQSAEQYVLALLEQSSSSSTSSSTSAVELLDSSYFEQVELAGGYVWFLRPDYGDGELPQYGLVDESTKLDLNTATGNQLAAMPGIGESIGNRIIDWRDENDTKANEEGSEADDYQGGPAGYLPRNGNFVYLEELLMVAGMSPVLYHGDEMTIAQAGGTYVQPATMELDNLYQQIGLEPFLTVNGAAATLSSEEPIDLSNNETRNEVADYVSETIADERGEQFSVRIRTRNQPYRDAFHMANDLDMTRDELKQVYDRLSPGGNGVKVNVNAAPPQVLSAVIDDDSLVEKIVGARAGYTRQDPYDVTWLFEELEDEATGLGQFITGRGRYYSADIVAAAKSGRAFRRVRVIVDTETSPARIVYRRDLTDQGWPLDPTLLDQLRAGELATGASGPIYQ